MKPTVWKWIIGLSLAGFVLLVILTLGIWVLLNAGGVLLLLLSLGSEDIHLRGISLAEFMQNFVGSPMFYLFLADLTALAIGIAGLIATKNHPK